MTSRLGVRLFLVKIFRISFSKRNNWTPFRGFFSTFNICQLTLSVCQSPADVPAGLPEPRGRRRPAN